MSHPRPAMLGLIVARAAKDCSSCWAAWISLYASMGERRKGRNTGQPWHMHSSTPASALCPLLSIPGRAQFWLRLYIVAILEASWNIYVPRDRATIKVVNFYGNEVDPDRTLTQVTITLDAPSMSLRAQACYQQMKPRSLASRSPKGSYSSQRGSSLNSHIKPQDWLIPLSCSKHPVGEKMENSNTTEKAVCRGQRPNECKTATNESMNQDRLALGSLHLWTQIEWTIMSPP